MSTGTSITLAASHTLESPEHETWKKHRLLLRKIPPWHRWRGCIGLSAIVTHPFSGVSRQGRLFVPGKDLRWLSIVDIPWGHFRLRERREAHWAALHRTKPRFGMPIIGSQPEAACDVCSTPIGRMLSPRGESNGSAGETVNRRPTYFGVIDALSWAMTSTAFCFRRQWRAKRAYFFDAIGEAFHPDKKALLFGESHRA